MIAEILAEMGAEPVVLGRSSTFVPVDTEAVDDPTRARLADWAGTERLDAILSTDGDGDRPLMTDARGRVIPGDLLGQVTAGLVGAQAVVTPVTSNGGVELSRRFGRVLRCRIGSPHVIAGMDALRSEGLARTAGYEANGGFLLGFDAQGPAGIIPALMTRDAMLPMIAPLAEARRRASLSGDGTRADLAALVAAEPARFTASAWGTARFPARRTNDSGNIASIS